MLYKIVCGAYQLVDTGRIHPVRERALRALERSVDYIESAMPDALGLESQRDLIDYALQLVSIDGHYLETGVFTGGTIRYIARDIGPRTIHAFDSFKRLPEAWSGSGLGGKSFDVSKAVCRAYRIGIFGGLAVTLAVIALGRAETSGATDGFVDTWLLGGATYLAFAFGFWAFLNLNITSMRIRMLRQLLRACGRMALSDMAVSYTPAERLRRRLERLENGGQIMRENGRWRLRSWQVLAIARCVEGWRRFILPYRDRQPL